MADRLERRTLLAGISFGSPTVYGSGSSLGVLAVDMNNDGLVDVVSPNSGGGDDGVTVALNGGGGTLATPVSYPVADSTLSVSQPYALAAADFNGDGYLDVASANFGGSLSILLNNKAGGLTDSANYAAGEEPDGVAVGDFNGDGHPDVVVASRGSDAVEVYLNNGDGTFAAGVSYPVGSAPNNVAVADLNGDGHPDIVTANYGDDTLSVLINNGDGTFSPAVSVADPQGATDVKVADMNKDGLADLVVSDSSAFVSIYLGNGTGTTFGAPMVEPAGSANEDLVVADLNGDGTPDVAVAEYTNQTVDVLLGNGDGTLQAPVSVPAGLDAWSISAGDLNGDGTTDLVTGSYGSSVAFATLLNGGTPTTAVVKSIGGLDPTFGTAGLASHDVGFTATTGVATDGTQSVLVGPVGAAPGEAFGVARYDASGNLDTSFGSGGVAVTPFAGADAVPSAVDVLADGDILVAGTATVYAADGVTVLGSRFAVAEYTAAGQLDPSFGSGGIAYRMFYSALSNDVLHAMAIGPGGVIYLGGSSDSAGKGNSDLAVARLTPAGAIDTTFVAVTDVAGGDDVVNGLAVQADGDLVATGSATVGGTTEVVVARYLADGALDKRFGTKGITTTKVGGVYDAAESVVLQPKGQIVIGGLTATGSAASLSSDFLVQRYTSAGKLDRTFGTAGTAVTSFGQPAAVTQVLLQSDGSIVASGRTSATLGGTLDVAIARYTTRGTLDASFAGTGKVVVDLTVGVVASRVALRAAITSGLGAAFDALTSSSQGVLAVTSGGEIVAAGNSGANTVEAELVAAGVDLVAKVLSALPASVLGGLKATATISITESGTTAAAGSVTIALEFATSAAGTGAATVKSFPEKLNLKQGQSKSYKLAYNYPANLATGGYYLLAAVTNGAGVPADLDAANNTAATAAAVQIAPPFISLTGTDLAAASAFAAGRSATVTLDVANGGNVTAKGKTTVDLYLSRDDTVADGTMVGTAPLVLGLSAGSKPKVYRLKFTLPAGTASGSFNLLALLDPDNALGTNTNSDALVVGASPVTVT